VECFVNATLTNHHEPRCVLSPKRPPYVPSEVDHLDWISSRVSPGLAAVRTTLQVDAASLLEVVGNTRSRYYKKPILSWYQAVFGPTTPVALVGSEREHRRVVQETSSPTGPSRMRIYHRTCYTEGLTRLREPLHHNVKEGRVVDK
jgi:hypothetical protein